MQHVYVAFDELFERQVALKTPKDDAGAKRFGNSAVVSARINHQNIAKTLDYFEVKDRPYLVEELIVGSDLYAISSNFIAVLPPSTCARILHQLAKGLSASHAADVVHRDLKPSNIMVSKSLSFEEIKITDFGIAKMAEGEIGQWAEAGGATSSKTVLGAIPYMSPESIEDFKTPRKSSDVWAIAAITYELLSGTLPFGSGLKCIPRILEAAPPSRPSQIHPSQFTELGEQLYQILLRCLAKDESARPNADELVKACEGLCYNVPQYGVGVVSEVGRYTHRIRSDDDKTLMYHNDNIYGGGRLKVGDRVWFGRDPGEPWERAFPIVKFVSPKPVP
ncbi:serine/threonine-protein kinase [Aureimonas jatrophae]|uniref:Serine/threonine protein kinase n=2 Tax=Aureimonas jatrophae TaxID=1166073 RepID=A0A1H0NI00_9HYPH|nr:serine/threonine-protein kinase [Aureimonas jatrophae]SDO92198.1 serine/threonine protein kinase [Aureimonas jatrophae]